MQIAITTRDNPFSPLHDKERWRQFDEQHGYFTMNYLMRVCRQSSLLSEDDNNAFLEDAIDEIIKFNGPFYVKVKE
jgi:hypothetical protein